MASGERILESIEEEMAGHGTPQAITITIVEPSAWRPEPAGLHTTTYDSTALVTSVQAQDAVGQDTSTLVVVPGEGGGHRRRINVSHGAKGSIQTVSADGHITTQELPIISSVCSNEDETSQHSTIQVSNKIEPSDTHGILSVEGEVIEESEEIDDSEDTIGHHCLVCNVELPIHANDEAVPLFKTDTTATQRKMAVYLGILVGRKLTSGRVHSDTICRRCFSLLDRVDSLEVEIKETKEEIVNKYLDTQAAYGGRAQRRKTVAPKQSDYVYPKVVEPEDEVDEVLKLEMDDNFEPSMDDLIEEEQDQQEDHNTQDEEWEPEFRRPRVKREAPDLDPSGQPKRKRGRPRKDASRPKSVAYIQSIGMSSDRPTMNIKEEDANFRQNHFQPQQFGERRDVMGYHVIEEITKREEEGFNEHETPLTIENLPSQFTKQCPVCFEVFPGIPFFIKHFFMMHRRIATINCNFCNEVISGDVYSYILHCETHEGEYFIQTSKDADFVKKHWKSFSERQIECSTCHKVIKIGQYSKHLESHERVPCEFCNILLCKRQLDRHINNTHTKEISYPCSDCSAVYYDKAVLFNHRRRNHMGAAARRHMCEMCGKKFLSPSDLKIHVNGVHLNVKKFVCEVCGASYKIASALKYHLRTHTGEKPHVCHVCGKSFTRGPDLRKHLRLIHHIHYKGKYILARNSKLSGSWTTTGSTVSPKK